MPELSLADHSQSPPALHIPRSYNAAYDLIERNLRAGYADKLAFIDDQRSLTYRELDQRSAAFANILGSLGIERERRILLCMHDTIDLPIAFLGAIKAGVIATALAILRATLNEASLSGQMKQFAEALDLYADSQWQHMRMEEEQILPLAERELTEEDWDYIDAAFAVNRESRW